MAKLTRFTYAACLIVPLLLVGFGNGAEAREKSWKMLQTAGDMAFEAGLYDDALYQFTAALQVTETLGEPDLRQVTTLESLAATHFRRGDYAAMEPLLRRALAITEQIFGRNHVRIAESLDNFATLHSSRGNPAAEIKVLERAWNIRAKALGPNDPKTVATADRLAAAQDQPHRTALAGMKADGVHRPAEAVATARTKAPKTFLAAMPAGDAAPTTETATEAMKGPTYLVQLAALRAEDQAHAEWFRLQRAYPQELGRLDGDAVRADVQGKGIWYRVQAGTFAEYASADQVCARLENHGQDCLVVKR